MKKTLLIFAVALMLSACTNKTVVTPQIESGETDVEVDNAIVCADMCETTVQDLCKEEISANQEAGINMEESILDESYCQLACETEWNDDTFECVSAADTCAQFMDTAPYCIENRDTGEEIEATEPGNCEKACRRYSDCASYTEGVGPADIEDAFESCLQICPSWSDEQRNCVANTVINSASDCARQTACVLPQVKELMGR
jgi:hypothetical protein